MTGEVVKGRVIRGIVVSNKMTDAIVVTTERQVKHPIYQKYIRRTTKLHARDKGNTAKPGDLVELRECRPVSKTICWELISIKESVEQTDI